MTEKVQNDQQETCETERFVAEEAKEKKAAVERVWSMHPGVME
jgi:hypothetical protein